MGIKMILRKIGFWPVTRVLGFSLLLGPSIYGQGGKTALEWLKQYSPTGYFIINDYETRANKPGDHKQHLSVTTSPVTATAVHEICHMRNGFNGGNANSYYIGNLKDYKFAKSFTPFNSKEMMPDIPAALVNFQTDVYISGAAGTSGAYSQVGGLYGIFEEFDAYVTEVKSSAEMGACFKANFNAPKNWNDLAGEIITSVWSNSEFRYFSLRYILWAQKKYPDTYAKILASKEIRQCYTYLTQFADLAINEWMAVLKEQNMDTKTQNGFDDYWKYWNEIQKPEYKELEKLLLIDPVGLARPMLTRGKPGLTLDGMPPGLFDLRGRMMPSRQSGNGNSFLCSPTSSAFNGW